MRPFNHPLLILLILVVILTVGSTVSAEPSPPCTTSVPIVVGLTLEEANEVLTKNNLTSISVIPSVQPPSTSRSVVSQTPVAGVTVPCNTLITLTIPEPSTHSTVKIEIIGVEDGGIYRTSVKPIVRASDPEASIVITLDNRPYDLTEITAEGSYTLIATTSDSSGNRFSRKVSFTLDKTPPKTVVITAEPLYSTSKTLFLGRSSTIELFAEDVGKGALGVDRIEYRLDDAPQWKAYQEPLSLSSYSEGAHTLYYRSVDRSGNSALFKSFPFFFDAKSPSSELEIGAPKQNNQAGGFYVSGSTPFSISAMDEGSGIARIEYRLDGGEWRTYGEQLRVADEGEHRFEFRAIDNIGNMESIRSANVVTDSTPPITTLTFNEGQTPNSSNTIFINKPAVISLIAIDMLSGVYSTEYRIDQDRWQPYTKPFTVNDHGIHQVYFRSQDNVNNQEQTKAVAVVVDKTAPVTKISIGSPQLTSSNGIPLVSDSTFFTLSANDSQSGIERTEYRFDQGEWLPYSPFTIQEDRSHTIEFRSLDRSGNVEPSHVIKVNVYTIPPTTAISIDGKQYESGATVYSAEPFKVTLSVLDRGAGIKSTEYKLDEGQWTPYQSFSVSAEGTHLIEFRSLDKLDNLEPARFSKLIIDRTPPTTHLIIGEPKKTEQDNVIINDNTVISLSANDPLSGVASSEYRISGSSERKGSEPFSIMSSGEYQIHYWSIDKVGNREKEKIARVKVDIPNTLATPLAKVNRPPDKIKEPKIRESVQTPLDPDIPDSIRISKKPATQAKDRSPVSSATDQPPSDDAEYIFWGQSYSPVNEVRQKDRTKEYITLGGINAVIIAIIFLLL